MDIHHHKLLRCGRWLAIVEMPIAKNCQYLDTITYHWGENQCWPDRKRDWEGSRKDTQVFPRFYLVGGLNPSEKQLVKWEGWHPIYEMDNQKCLKPPTSCRWAEPPTFQLSGGCHLLVTSQPVLRPFGSADPKRPNTAFLTGLTDTVSKKTPKKYNSALGANIFHQQLVDIKPSAGIIPYHPGLYRWVILGTSFLGCLSLNGPNGPNVPNGWFSTSS